jgi:DNA-directed RNA polymerase specialized sigma24 family protein
MSREHAIEEPDDGRGQEHPLRLVPVEAEQADHLAKTGSADDQLLARGYPVAYPVGLVTPDLVANDDDPALTYVLVAQLHRELERLPTSDQRVMRLIWGIGCRPHTHRETAELTGLTRHGVMATLRRSMNRLQEAFGAGATDSR